MGDDLVSHTHHENNHVIKDIKRSCANEEIKPVQVALPNTFRCPWAVVIVVFDADVTLSAVVCFPLLDSPTFETKSESIKGYLLFFT